MYKQREEDEGVLPFFRQLKVIMLLSTLFAALLLVDKLLPPQCETQEVLNKTSEKENNRFGGTDYTLKLHTRKQSLIIPAAVFEDVPENGTVDCCKSPIFGMVVRISGVASLRKKPFSHEVVAPVYKGYSAYPILLLVLSLVALLFRSDDTIAYGAGILAMILLVCTLIVI